MTEPDPIEAEPLPASEAVYPEDEEAALEDGIVVPNDDRDLESSDDDVDPSVPWPDPDDEDTDLPLFSDVAPEEQPEQEEGEG